MIDRFRSEDWPMLPHSEPESYPDDWENKPKTHMKTKQPTAKQIQQEIKDLEALKPRLPRTNMFGDNLRDAVDAQIEVLEQDLDEEQIHERIEEEIMGEDNAWSEYQRDNALEAYQWLQGEDVENPSIGWKPLCNS